MAKFKMFTLALATIATLSLDAIGANKNVGKYEMDVAHTNVNFSVSHLGIGNVVGRFNKFSGDVEITEDSAKVSVEVNVSSVDTNNSQRDAHLRKADFFDVTRFPTMTFESTTVEFDSEGLPMKMTGDLTLHGVTQTVAFDITPLGAGETAFGDTRVGFNAMATIKRTDFGMDKLLVAAGNEVTIFINYEGILK